MMLQRITSMLAGVRRPNLGDRAPRSAPRVNASRRRFLRLTSAAAIAPFLGGARLASAQSTAPHAKDTSRIESLGPSPTPVTAPPPSGVAVHERATFGGAMSSLAGGMVFSTLTHRVLPNDNPFTHPMLSAPKPSETLARMRERAVAAAFMHMYIFALQTIGAPLLLSSMRSRVAARISDPTGAVFVSAFLHMAPHALYSAGAGYIASGRGDAAPLILHDSRQWPLHAFAIGGSAATLDRVHQLYGGLGHVGWNMAEFGVQLMRDFRELRTV